MTDVNHSSKQHSPFHEGEQALQERLGVREQMERFGRRVIRDYLPDQHQQFYRQLPYVFIGHADEKGWPWASILVNPPGFMHSPDDKTLVVNSRVLEGDPLQKGIATGARLGLLGIELSTRRRNRMAAHIVAAGAQGFTLKVDQSFGNCPRYIRLRLWTEVAPEDLPPAGVSGFSVFDVEARALISNSDTFFVASFIESSQAEAREGADVSHRGGNPGFVHVDDDRTLTIPDYAGNMHFNTLGNFLKNPKAGLLFIDFANGHLLTLTGRVEILFDSPKLDDFSGAERLWRFELHQGYWLKNVLTLRWQASYSP